MNSITVLNICAKVKYIEFSVEIIARVASKETPAFRPAVSQRDCPEDLIELMEKCWSDNCDERPSFEAIRSTIRCIMK